jgi:hypothetical protein
MSHPRVLELETLGSLTFRLEHIASNAIAVQPDELAVEAAIWMEANDFDAAPIAGTRAVVSRATLERADVGALASSCAEDLPDARSAAGAEGLSASLPRLVEGSLFLVEDGVVVGVATPHDLGRPAVSLYSFAVVTALEHGLRRLMGGYTNRPLTEWAPSHTNTTETDEFDTSTFERLMNRATASGPLRTDLGERSRSSFMRRLKPLRNLRNDLAHGRSLLHGRSPAKALEDLLGAQTLAREVWALVREREQVWDAYESTRVVPPGGSASDHDWTFADARGSSFVISAHNPFEEVLTTEANERRNRALRRLLELRGYAFEEVDGVSPDGRWREPSFLIRGIERQTACQLGHRFGQRAVFELRHGCQVVVDIEGRERRSRRLDHGA